MITYLSASASASSRVSEALIITNRNPALYFFTKSIGASLGCCHLLTSEPCIRPPGPSGSTEKDAPSTISGIGLITISRVGE